MAQTYNIISIVAFSLAGVGLIVSVILWFKFGIWGIIGDLSGRTAKKSIEQMRAENEKSGIKSYRPSPIALDRGGLTEAVELIKSSNTATEKLDPEENVTELLADGTEVLVDGTEVLVNETEVLEETGLLNETTLLSEAEDMDGATELLTEEFESFQMIQDIILIHTNETI